MAFKEACVLFSAILIQTITGQVLRASQPGIYPTEISTTELPLAYPISEPIAASPMAYEAPSGPGVPGLTFGLSLSELSASNGGGLLVNSASPMASTGVTIETDKMVIEGPLAVTGQLPFLGAVALEGPLPASGTGTVAYECSNGEVGIVSEGVEPAPVLAQAYPNGPLPQGYPHGQHAHGYPTGPYPNMPLAPGYHNAGPPSFGYGPMPRA